MKRVLASISLGKEVTVSSHLFSEREVGLEGGAWTPDLAALEKRHVDSELDQAGLSATT